jgi:hypothetical protein
MPSYSNLLYIDPPVNFDHFLYLPLRDLPLSYHYGLWILGRCLRVKCVAGGFADGLGSKIPLHRRRGRSPSP